ncbi:MAG: hypothetical protein AAF266_09105 [Planctomycetota bacterium]
MPNEGPTATVPFSLDGAPRVRRDALRDRSDDREVEQITPQRKNRDCTKRQNGRKLRTYRRCWTMQRTVSWLHDLSRLVVSREAYSPIYHGFPQARLPRDGR